MDNQTDAGLDHPPLKTDVYYQKRDFQNPIYGSGAERKSTNLNASNGQMNEGLYSEVTQIRDETMYDSANYAIPQDHLVPTPTIRKQRNNHDQMNHDETGEDNTAVSKVKDGNYYSELGPVDYSTLQPHIPKHKKQLCPPAKADYSQLHHE